MIEEFAQHLATAHGSRVVRLGEEVVADGDVVLAELAARSSFGDLLDAASRAAAIVVAGGSTPDGLADQVRAGGLDVVFEGWAARTFEGPKDTPIAIVDRFGLPAPSIPADFRVVAFVPVFNEIDVVAGTIEALVRDGIEVYVLDNWSTDGSYEAASSLLGRGVIEIERLPASGPTAIFESRLLHDRVANLAAEIPASWFVHVDADERRPPPWPAVPLRRALAHVERSGFNCVDYTVLEFHPVDDGFEPSGDAELYFRHFRFGHRPGSFLQIRAWKNLGIRVDRTSSLGHDAQFPGRRPYPYKFLAKHYPFRSSHQAARKAFHERRDRWSPEEQAAGFNVHYDDLRPDHNFLRSLDELEEFSEPDFSRRYLIERLSGIGIPRTPPQAAGRSR